MRTFDAFWLPEPPADLAFETLPFTDPAGGAALECRYPVPTPALLEATIQSLRAAGRTLGSRPTEEIVEAIDAAAARLADAGDPLRLEADRLVSAATGYSPQMTTLILDRMTADWRAPALRRLLRAELQDPAVLDGFVPRGDGAVRAYGPGLAFHVFAGNVPGVAVTSMIRTLLVKAPSLGKLASGEPVLPILFARALHSVDSALASALAITYWPGGSQDAEARLMEAADLVVVYGGAEAAASYRGRVPSEHRLVVHGPRFSAGLISQEALDDGALPARVARAVATFDQHGCVSPHAVWVEDPSRARMDAFAEALADALQELQDELPRGAVSPAEASFIQQARGAAEIRGYAGAVRVLAGSGTTWTVVLDHEPTFQPSCLNRFIYIHPIDSLDTAPDLLAPARHRLQSVAVEAPPQKRLRIAHDLARIGANRITSFDRLPWPPPEWHHDGRGPLRELLRWVDLEE